MGNAAKKPYSRLISEDQTIKPLSELLPLPVPLTILIDPTNLCNFKCKFCPTGNDELLRRVNRPSGCMAYDLFCKILDDLSSMVQESGQKVKRLHLYKDGEPLINKKLYDMVAYAKKLKVADSIEITSNGSLITREKAIELIESGLDIIRISVEHVTDGGYKDITGTAFKYEQIKGNISFLFKEKERKCSPLKIHAKILDSGLTAVEREKFLVDFSSITDSVFIDNLMGWSLSQIKDFTLGQIAASGMEGADLVDRKVCPEPFAHLAVNFDGRVSVCCVDWSYGTIIGDLCHQSLKEVWYGRELNQFRLLHLRGERHKIKACASCQFLKGLPTQKMLDHCAESLLEVYCSAGLHDSTSA